MPRIRPALPILVLELKKRILLRQADRPYTPRMPAQLPTNFCEDVMDYIHSDRFNLTTYQDTNQTYEDDVWFIKVHWFPANENYPEGHHMRPPMVEVYARFKPSVNPRARACFVYKNGTGNDIHPEFRNTGWRFHMV